MKFEVVNNQLQCTERWPADMTVDQALDESILKWTAIRNHIEKHAVSLDDGGIQTCALCVMFWVNEECEGCPVSLHTGIGGCSDTPYEETGNYNTTVAEELDIANAELLFLRKVREARKANPPEVPPQVEG